MHRPDLTTAPAVTLWQALLTLPRINSDQWSRLGLVMRWLIVCRAPVFPLTFFACGFAACASWPLTNPGLFVIASAGVLLAHASNNLINDHIDYRSGLDKDNYFRTRYGVQPLESNLLSVREHARYILLTGTLALSCGIVVVSQLGERALLPLLAGGFFVVFYTYPLKRIALGEIAVWLVWGPLMVGALSYVGSGHWTSTALWLGSLYGLGPFIVIFGKHTDKIGDDIARQVTTLPTILGERRARRVMASAAILQIGLAVGWAVSASQLEFLLVLLAVPACWRFFKQLSKPAPEAADSENYDPALQPLWFTAGGFRFAATSGFLLVIAAALGQVV